MALAGAVTQLGLYGGVGLPYPPLVSETASTGRQPRGGYTPSRYIPGPSRRREEEDLEWEIAHGRVQRPTPPQPEPAPIIPEKIPEPAPASIARAKAEVPAPRAAAAPPLPQRALADVIAEEDEAIFVQVLGLGLLDD